MARLKTVQLACEIFREEEFGLIILDHIADTFDPFDFDEYPLSKGLIDRLGQWYTSYYPLTSKTGVELSTYNEKIAGLDKEGINILVRLGEELKGKLSCRLEYYSRGKEKVLHSLEI